MDLLAMTTPTENRTGPLLLKVCCAIIFSTTLLLPAGAETSAQSVSVLEQHLFFTTYPKEDLASRLNRLENRVFGQTIQGTNEERINKLSSITPQIQSNQLPAQKPAITAKTSSSNNSQEDECFLERAKVAVMAAKEEEIMGLLAQGVELWRSKRGQEALEKFEQVLRLDPQNAEAHFSMGIIEEAAGNFVEALSSYRLASNARPDNTEYRTALSTIEKKFAGKQLVDTQQSEVRQLSEDAVSAYKRGEYMSALDLYKTLDQKSPKQPLISYNIGTIYLMIKQPEKALIYYQQAHRLDPKDQRFSDALAKLQGVVKQNQGALAQMGANTKYHATAGALAAAPPPTQQTAMASYGILGKSSNDGIYITTIGIASRASQVGLQRGDIIRAVDGTIVKNPSELNQILSRKNPKAPVQLMVQRDKNLTPVVL